MGDLLLITIGCLTGDIGGAWPWALACASQASAPRGGAGASPRNGVSWSSPKSSASLKYELGALRCKQEDPYGDCEEDEEVEEVDDALMVEQLLAFDEKYDVSYDKSAILLGLNPIWIGWEGDDEHEGGVELAEESMELLLLFIVECIAARRKCNNS